MWHYREVHYIKNGQDLSFSTCMGFMHDYMDEVRCTQSGLDLFRGIHLRF